MTALLLWLLLFGLWPLADPGHSDLGSPLVLLDLVLHFWAGWMLLQRMVRWFDERTAAAEP